MKTLVALVLMLGLGFVAVAQPARTPAAAPGGKDAAKKDEAPPKIEGMEIARGARGYLGLQVLDGRFVLSFYDAKKKPVAPDMTQAALRWDPKGTIGTERTMLTAGGDGKSLTSAKVIRPPYMFRLYMTLQKLDAQGAAAESENLVVDFRQ